MDNYITLVTIIVNSGYAEKAMEVVKQQGARGGTIFNAIGSASVHAEVLYGIKINPEKEVVLVLVPTNISDKILKKLYQTMGPQTDAQGLAFTMPVEDATTNLTKQYKKEKQETKTISNETK